MGVEIVTKEDLQIFRMQLLDELSKMLAQPKEDAVQALSDGVRTNHARKLLNCSNGKLLSLRSSNAIRCKKIGGTLYYNRDDIRKLLNKWR